MPNVFVSYSRRGARFVTRLAEGLTARGKDVWVDVDALLALAQTRVTRTLGARQRTKFGVG